MRAEYMYILMVRLSLFSIAFAALMMGCSTLKVSYDYDAGTDFTGLKTFDWVPAPERDEEYEDVMARARDEVDGQLRGKGITRSVENPDFLIAVYGGKEVTREVMNWGYTHARSQIGRYERNRYPRGRTMDVYENAEGELLLNFINPETKELFWQGSARGAVVPDPTAARRDSTIREAVTKILENFPPGPSGGKMIK
jgi:hypothetical protein